MLVFGVVDWFVFWVSWNWFWVGGVGFGLRGLNECSVFVWIVCCVGV